VLREKISATAMRRGPLDRLGKTPAFPVGDAAVEVPQSTASHLHLKDLRCVSDHQIAQPLREGWPSTAHRKLDAQGLLQRAPLSIGEADERSMMPRMLQRWPSDCSRRLPDIRKSAEPVITAAHKLSALPQAPSIPKTSRGDHRRAKEDDQRLRSEVLSINLSTKSDHARGPLPNR
jgi:hypothetical protein